MKKTYRVAIEGDIEGAYRKAGDEVQLTDEQAKYPLMAGTIAPAKAVNTLKPARSRKAAAPETDSKQEAVD